MGAKGPKLAEVRTFTEGIAPEAIENVRTKINGLYGNGTFSKGDPWRTAKKELDNMRALWSAS